MTGSASVEGAIVGRRIDDRTLCIFPVGRYLLVGLPGRYQQHSTPSCGRLHVVRGTFGRFVGDGGRGDGRSGRVFNVRAGGGREAT